jgi:hypothetical protein
MFQPHSESMTHRTVFAVGSAIVGYFVVALHVAAADHTNVAEPPRRAARSVSIELQATESPGTVEPTIRDVLPTRDAADLISQAMSRPQPREAATAKLGADEALLQPAGATRPWGMSATTWEAPAFCHRPLYFEDENLERHGRSFGLAQPAVSAAHFVGRGAAWPYLAGAFPTHECIYTLGRERPGNCAPYWLHRPPASLRGAVYQGVAVTGLSFVVP